MCGSIDEYYDTCSPVPTGALERTINAEGDGAWVTFSLCIVHCCILWHVYGRLYHHRQIHTEDHRAEQPVTPQTQSILVFVVDLPIGITTKKPMLMIEKMLCIRGFAPTVTSDHSPVFIP